MVCDDTCQGRTRALRRRHRGRRRPGRVRARCSTTSARPACPTSTTRASPSRRAAECVGGVKPVFWSDDGDTGGNALRAGTLNCTAPGRPDRHLHDHRAHQPGRRPDLHRRRHRWRLRQPGRDLSIAAGSAGGLLDRRRRGHLQPPGLLRGQGRPGRQRRLRAGHRPAVDHGAQGRTRRPRSRPTATTHRGHGRRSLAPGVGTPTGTVAFAVDGMHVGNRAAHRRHGHAGLHRAARGADAHGDRGLPGQTPTSPARPARSTAADPTITASVSSPAGRARRRAGTAHAGHGHVHLHAARVGADRRAARRRCTLSTLGGRPVGDPHHHRRRTVARPPSPCPTSTSTWPRPTVAIKGVKAGKTYPKKRKPTCGAPTHCPGWPPAPSPRSRTGKEGHGRDRDRHRPGRQRQHGDADLQGQEAEAVAGPSDPGPSWDQPSTSMTRRWARTAARARPAAPGRPRRGLGRRRSAARGPSAAGTAGSAGPRTGRSTPAPAPGGGPGPAATPRGGAARSAGRRRPSTRGHASPPTPIAAAPRIRAHARERRRTDGDVRPSEWRCPATAG